MFDPNVFRAAFSCFNATPESHPFIYLDNAASTQIPDEVSQAVFDYESHGRSNVKRGIYHLAEEATERYEDARQAVSHYLGVADADDVVFTNGTTSGINMVATAISDWINPEDEIMVSQLEHHSNIVPWQLLAQRTGARIRTLPVDANGDIDFGTLDTLLSPKTRLVALTHGSNVTGVKPRIQLITERVRHVNAMILLDGAQRAPHGPLDLSQLDIDFYVFSGHKVFGPNGIGALWGRKEILDRLPPAVGGGEMVTRVSMEKSEYMPPPHRFEAGTPPIAQAIGLGAALKWVLKQDMKGASAHMTALTAAFLNGLKAINQGKDRIQVLGPSAAEDRLPLISFSLKSVHSHDVCQVMNDEFTIATRGGDHCAQPAHVALGVNDSVRVSFAPYNTEPEVNRCLESVHYCLDLLGS